MRISDWSSDVCSSDLASEAELREEVDIQLRRMNDLVGYQLGRAASAGHKLFAAPIDIEPHAEQIVRGLEKIYADKGVICEFDIRSEEHTSELQSLMRISYAVFCLKKKNKQKHILSTHIHNK